MDLVRQPVERRRPDPDRAQAHRHGIETVYIKSSDGSSSWSQFTPALISYLHSRGLRVCGWQFVYGIHPGAEAKRGAEAVGRVPTAW